MTNNLQENEENSLVWLRKGRFSAEADDASLPSEILLLDFFCFAFWAKKSLNNYKPFSVNRLCLC